MAISDIERTTPAQMTDSPSTEQVHAFIGQMVSSYQTHWDESHRSVFNATRGLITDIYLPRLHIIDKRSSEDQFTIEVLEVQDQVKFGQELLRTASSIQNHPGNGLEIIAPEGITLNQNFAGDTFFTVLGYGTHDGHRRQMIMQVIGDGYSPLRVTTVEFIP